LRDQSQTTSTASQSNDAPAPTSTEPPARQVPESYTFTAPEGRTVDKALVDRATPVFKELGLDQAQGQKLVDIYNDLTKDLAQSRADDAVKAVMEMRANWREQVTKDPSMGGKLEAIQADIGRMKDAIFGSNKADREAFENAMNLTGAGDHPAIVKAWWKASEAYREGQHVSGNAPSRHGQTPPNTESRPSAAQAMYPNLPSATAVH
jgi:hypothetical protein